MAIETIALDRDVDQPSVRASRVSQLAGGLRKQESIGPGCSRRTCPLNVASTDPESRR
jgi:hypothetical protein